MTRKISYFNVNQYGNIGKSPGCDTAEDDKAVLKFFKDQPTKVLDALGIAIVVEPHPHTKLNHKVEETNSIASDMGLPYRFKMEFWISDDQDAHEFLDAINISYWDVIEEVLRTMHGMADVDEDAIIKAIENPDFRDEFDSVFYDQLSDHISQYTVDREEVDEASGTWGYSLISISNLSITQKETKELIISITEKILAKIKKGGKPPKKSRGKSSKIKVGVLVS